VVGRLESLVGMLMLLQVNCAYSQLALASNVGPQTPPNKITDLSIKGNSVLGKDEIETQLSHFFGKSYNPKICPQIAQQLTDYYRDKGYVYSYVYECHFKGKTISLSIIEGEINKVVYADTLKDNNLFQHYITKLQEIKPFNLNEAEEYFLLIPGIAGITNLDVGHEFVPSGDEYKHNIKAYNLILDADYSLIDGELNLNNRSRKENYSNVRSFAGINQSANNPNAGNVTVNFNNFFKKDEKVSINYLSSWDREINAVDVTVEKPLNKKGTKGYLRFSYANQISGIDVKQESVAAGVKHPLIVTKDNYVEAMSELTLLEDGYKQKKLINEKLKVTRLTLGLRQVKIMGKLKAGYNVQLNKGLKALGAKKTKFFKEDLAFTRFNMVGNASYTFNDKYSLLFLLSTQHSKNSLPPTETFSVGGGEEFGRGFNYGEIAGDQGIAATIEFSSTDLMNHHFFLSHREYVFLDAGMVKNKKPSDAADYKTAKLSSIGMGIDLQCIDNIIFNLELTKPLKITGVKNSKNKKKAGKLFVGLKYYFAF
jgi:hemolysin activation/secretion protein